MGNISSTNESPYGYLADLFQSKFANFKKDMQKSGNNVIVGRPFKRSDPMPSWYYVPSEVKVQQTGIGDQKTILKHMLVLVMYYTDDLDQDLFVIEQIITQIVVSNNKIKSTKRYKITGQEYMQLGDFTYGYVYDRESNHERSSIFTHVKVAYQDSYY